MQSERFEMGGSLDSVALTKVSLRLKDTTGETIPEVLTVQATLVVSSLTLA